MQDEEDLLAAEMKTKFSHLFSKELGMAKGFAPRGERRETAEPVASRLRRLSLALREAESMKLR